MATILLLLASVGFTFIITRSFLFEELRQAFLESEMATTLLSCPQCMGFWVNLFFSLFVVPILTFSAYEILLFIFGTSFAASGICYVINSFIEK